MTKKMTSLSNLDIQWQVQMRVCKESLWVVSGLFETRKAAREKCTMYRAMYGRGHSRVVKYIKPSQR